MDFWPQKVVSQPIVHCHLQKIIKNMSKVIFTKFFLQLLLFLFEETFGINKFKFSRREKKYTNSSFSTRTELVKKCIVPFKRHLNCLSIDAKV